MIGLKIKTHNKKQNAAYGSSDTRTARVRLKALSVSKPQINV